MIDTGTHRLLFDPFISGNPLAEAIDVKSLMPQYILVSHGHADHLADCVDIAHQSNAKVICNYEVGEWLRKHGITQIHSGNYGGKLNYDFGFVKIVNAVHSSIMPDETYGGNPVGFLINIAGKNIYYAGDTGLTMDMKLIPLWGKPDVAFLPLGNTFTMDVDDAIMASNFVECNNIIGMHYDTFPPIRINHEEAKQKFADAGKKLNLLWVGESMEI